MIVHGSDIYVILIQRYRFAAKMSDLDTPTQW